MGRLILVRHGQTVANVGRVLDTRLPGAPLTPEGQKQAAEFATRYAPTDTVNGLPALLSSEALRARQTANIIGAAWGVRPGIVEGIFEIQAGELEGRSDEDAHAAFRSVVRTWYTENPAFSQYGVESATHLYARFLPALDAIRNQYLTGETDAYVVSHGAAIRLVAAYLGHVDPRFAIKAALANTASIVLAPDGDGWVCQRWDDHHPPFAPLGDDAEIRSGFPTSGDEFTAH